MWIGAVKCTNCVDDVRDVSLTYMKVSVWKKIIVWGWDSGGCNRKFIMQECGSCVLIIWFCVETRLVYLNRNRSERHQKEAARLTPLLGIWSICYFVPITCASTFASNAMMRKPYPTKMDPACVWKMKSILNCGYIDRWITNSSAVMAFIKDSFIFPECAGHCLFQMCDRIFLPIYHHNWFYPLWTELQKQNKCIFVTLRCCRQ